MLIDRRGKVEFVIVGTAREIVIPRLSDFRVDPGRLRGLRCVHTHLTKDPLTHDDLTDLALLRLDLMAAIEVSSKDGLPLKVHTAHILPQNQDGPPWMVLPSVHMSHFQLECDELISSIEKELARNYYSSSSKKISDNKRTIIISVTHYSRKVAAESIEELKELALTNDIKPLDTVILRPHKISPKYLMGKGQLKEVAISALTKGADTLLFNQNLTPTQANAISNFTDLIVIDRTQLILDIFGRRALSHDGKTKVELAQLKYALPRLTSKDDSLSRIRGGIGLRGPGETKMEIGRRRIQDRIAILEKELIALGKRRKLRKKERIQSNMPLISIVGYTNAGKSTLLNVLTKSNALVEDKLFATLDPTSRKMSLPGGSNVIISDTVGFIRELPTDLLDSFRSTLEEVDNADLILHLVDISNKNHERHIKVVQDLLTDLKLNQIPIQIVFNKTDLVDEETANSICKRYSAIPISAKIKYNIDSLNKMISSGLGSSHK